MGSFPVQRNGALSQEGIENDASSSDRFPVCGTGWLGGAGLALCWPAALVGQVPRGGALGDTRLCGRCVDRAKISTVEDSCHCVGYQLGGGVCANDSRPRLSLVQTPHTAFDIWNNLQRVGPSRLRRRGGAGGADTPICPHRGAGLSRIASLVRGRAKITCAVQGILLRPLMPVSGTNHQVILTQRLTGLKSAIVWGTRVYRVKWVESRNPIGLFEFIIPPARFFEVLVNPSISFQSFQSSVE